MSRFALRSGVWLAAASAVFAIAAGPPSPTENEIRRRADEVFHRSEFESREAAPKLWLTGQLQDFFVWLGSLYESSPSLFWVLLVGCIIALAALVVLIVLRVLSVFTAEGRWADGKSSHDVRRLDLSKSHREEADRMAAAAEYTEAVRHLFLSLVYRFDERGRVSFQKAYTNREYLDLLNHRLPVRDSLQVLVDMLDDHWYGQRPCGQSQYETCLAVYNRLAAV